MGFGISYEEFTAQMLDDLMRDPDDDEEMNDDGWYCGADPEISDFDAY